MLKRLIFILLVLFFINSCVKSDVNKCNYTESSVVAPVNEVQTLQAYITANSIMATQHTSGLFYEISNPGTGATATVCSNVTVKYAGYIASNGANNGTKFDENVAGITFPLGSLIVGWQKGIPLIKPGGIITIYLPPSLAYGSSTVGSIPPNSYLKFDIQLVSVQ